MTNHDGRRQPESARCTALTMPAWLSNMKPHSRAATTVGIAQGSSTAVRTRPRPRERGGAPAPAPAPGQLQRDGGRGEEGGVPEGGPEAGVGERFGVVAQADEGPAAPGMRRSCRCSDSQTVQTSGKMAIERDHRRAPAARTAHARRASLRATIAVPRCAGRCSSRCQADRASPSPAARASRAAASLRAARGSCWRVSARCSQICRISDSSL